MPTQLDYYIKNQDELVKKYNNQIIVVKDGKYIDTFTSKTEAMMEMLNRGFVPGTFMIILCTSGDSEYTSYFHTNVTFDEVGLN